MIEEKVIIGEGTDYPLKGILTLPDDLSKPVPAVVLVHGSGSSNMDEKVMKVTPFKDLAEGLASRGIAVVRYDKRTFTYGLKLIKKIGKTMTVKEEAIDDAILATNMLKADSRIDKDNVFIIGHSMGGMLAPRIDREGGDYKGVIIMAGSPRKMEEILFEQLEKAKQTSNFFVKWILNRQIKKLSSKFDGLYDLTYEEATSRKVLGNVYAYYFKDLGEKDYYINDIKKPVLFLQGDKDFQVSVEKDFNKYKEIFEGKDNATFILYKNLNHCLVRYITEDINKAKKEYGVERHIEQNVFDDIASWIKNC